MYIPIYCSWYYAIAPGNPVRHACCAVGSGVIIRTGPEVGG